VSNLSITTARPRPADLAVPSTAPADRMPPHDLNAEKSVLGSMLLNGEVIGDVLDLLQPEHFFKEEHGAILAVMAHLFNANKPVDATILCDEFTKRGQLEFIGGVEYLEALANFVPSSAHAVYYAAIVREKAQLRELILASTRILRDCYEAAEPVDAIADAAQMRMFKAAEQGAKTESASSLADTLHLTFEMLDKQSGEHLSGLATGYIELDNLTSGLQRGEMIVIASRPSVGKTALACNILEHVGIHEKKPAALFSMEMSKQQIAQRMLCSRSGVDSHKLRCGMLSVQDRERLAYAVGDMSQSEIYIDDTCALTVMKVRDKARRLKLKFGIELLIIDYLQLMEAGGKQDSRQQEVAVISRGIKALARELNIPVVCLSQLNRESESNSRMPRTSDLRESGAIEQDADVVMLLHREAVFHRGEQEWLDSNPDKINLAQLIVAKQRNGPCDTVMLNFFQGQTRFTNHSYGV